MKAGIQKSWISVIVAALAASLCCIVPLAAFFGSVGGAATYFDWIGPYRPYFIGISVLIFALAWYQKLKIAPRQAEHCCQPAKSSFWQSKKLLLIVTLFSAVLITFPYYSSLFYKLPKKTSGNYVVQTNFKYVRMNITGMGCTDCTKHIDGALMELSGVLSSRTSFEKAQTLVYFDPTKTNAESINHKIKEIGYQSALIKND